MKKGGLFLFSLIILLPCFSQESGTAIIFQTKAGKVYDGVITDVKDDLAKIYFKKSGLSVSLDNQKVQAINGAKKKTCYTIGSEVETKLQQEAANLLDQTLKACSYTEDENRPYVYRFCRFANCNLYLFYTAKGYDYGTIDYHIVKIDLTMARSNLLFKRQLTMPAKVKNREQTAIVEIAKHTNSAQYNEEEFMHAASWSNQPEYRNMLELYFLDEHSPMYLRSLESLCKTVDFLAQTCSQ